MPPEQKINKNKNKDNNLKKSFNPKISKLS